MIVTSYTAIVVTVLVPVPEVTVPPLPSEPVPVTS
jgi:hypothetical protein